MSRVSSKPIAIPKGVDVSLQGQAVAVKGPKGQLAHEVHSLVKVQFDDSKSSLMCSMMENNIAAKAQAGTARSILNNMIVGVSEGFSKTLELVGIGYRAQIKGRVLNLNLGFSHPVDYELPEHVQAEAPSNTQLVIKGADKQLVGQVAAEVRAFRPPEPYKGKGIRYADEVVARKEAKKK